MDADDDGLLTESDFRALTAVDETATAPSPADEYRRLIEAWTGV
jgi:hypothetical protein